MPRCLLCLYYANSTSAETHIIIKKELVPVLTLLGLIQKKIREQRDDGYTKTTIRINKQ